MGYESSRNRKAERRAVRRLASYLGAFDFVFLPKYARADAILFFEDGPPMLVEFKERACTSTQYRTLQISADKVETITTIGQQLKMDVVLLVEYDDVIGYYPVDVDGLRRYHRSIGGNSAREPEMMMNIPVREFVRIPQARRIAA